MFTQLGDVLAAENSTVVAEEDNDGWSAGPEGAELHGALVAIGKDDAGESRAEGAIHRWQF